MRLVVILVIAAGCGATPIDPGGADLAVPVVDLATAPDLATDKAQACASTFGAALTSAFGRLDGTVLAVVPPSHPTCPLPNNDHLVLQVTVGGAVYRMVVNVQSSFGDPRVLHVEVDAPLPGAGWVEGWHPGVPLDYVQTLNLHVGAFTPYEMPALVARLMDRITVGAKVSVFATSSGGASAHLVHRNKANADGAIILDPTGPSPRLLLFAFADQSF